LNPPPPNPQAPLDLYVSTRASTLDPWSKPVNLNDAGSPVNSTSPTVPDSAPYLSRDGKTLFFYSNRTDLEHHGGNDLFTCTREEIDGGEDGAIAAPTRTASQLVAPTPIVFVRGLLQAEPGNATLSGANHASANRPEEPVPSLLPNNSGLALGGVAAPSLADPTLDQRPVAPALDYFFAHHHGQAPSIGLDDEFDTPLGR
ncbi:MAG TPA: hypothetical protein VKE94_21645, partial [Gemmataceae bacterium]|nr:hypothetical protein [Gemmataceae bacterium]